MQDRELVEKLMSAAEAYVIALLREAVLEPLTPRDRRDDATISARFALLNLVEQLQQARPDVFE